MEAESEIIAGIVRELGKLPALGPDEDIYAAGFSSINALELLLGLEERFGVSIPDDQFVEARTPRALGALVARLKTAEGT